jgi:hypothetical protein
MMVTSMIHKKVRFRGKEYWYHQGFYSPLLSPLDHFDNNGNFLVDPFHSESFAIIEGDNIVRFGKDIGKISELEFL